MDLSVIIVNWKSRDYLSKCIASILAETNGIEFEIIVIDSASYDGCEKMLRDCYPDVQFIQSDENLGFAKANNRAFEISKGKCVLFLNPDTELMGTAVNVLYDNLQELPGAGVIGGKLLNTDGTIQTSCIKAFPTLLNQLLDADALRTLFPRARLWGMRPLFATSSSPSEVDVVSGACMMMRRAVFEEAGRFSTRYFMYSEDVDLCFKARKAGLRNFYVPSARVVHHGGGSTTQAQVSTFSSVTMLESRWRYFLNTRSKWYSCLYRAEMFAVSALRIVLGVLCWLFGLSNARRARSSAVLRKWSSRLRWTLGLEHWASEQ